jgi:DNA-3-methyladenine glycosylase
VVPLSRETLTVPTSTAARILLGCYVISRDDSGTCVGRIVETEAYGGPEDSASHARAGHTPRTAPMFGAPGLAYVYLVYGMHECLNVVAHPPGGAGAVLLRALEPVSGQELMRRRRGVTAAPDVRLASGPGRLCRAMRVDRSLSGHDLSSGRRLWLEPPADNEAVAAETVASGPRVGVAYAGPEWASRPWRFWLRGHPSVSRP